MANEAERQELVDKVGKLFDERFGGDHRQAFAHYDRDQKGIDREELLALLADAGIGSWLTRGFWADGILGELDTDKDGVISLSEFETVLTPQKAQNTSAG